MSCHVMTCHDMSRSTHLPHELPPGPVDGDGGLHLRVQEAVEEADHQTLDDNNKIKTDLNTNLRIKNIYWDWVGRWEGMVIFRKI